QLLERLGFSRAHLSARVDDLSGGQRRRLQLLLVLLSEPNVLILDEPTNDVDTDMLTAMEDLLDTWPGTLIVVSHDRYLLERVTDQQQAILGGRLRHVPGGVREYLQLREAQASGGSQGQSSGGGSADHSGTTPGGGTGASAAGLDGAQLRAAQKRIASIERKLDKLSDQIVAQHERLAAHDHTDYEGLQNVTEELRELQGKVATLEEEWLEITEEIVAGASSCPHRAASSRSHRAASSRSHRASPVPNHRRPLRESRATLGTFQLAEPVSNVALGMGKEAGRRSAARTVG